MNKGFSFWISLIAILISIATILLVFSRVRPIGIDYFGSLVGVLAILVTILIGYQIYNSLDIKNKLNEFEKTEDRISVELERLDMDLTRSRLKSTLSAIYLSSTQLKDFDLILTGAHMIDMFMDAIKLNIKIGDHESANNLIDMVLDRFPRGYNMYQSIREDLIKKALEIPSTNNKVYTDKLIERIFTFGIIEDVKT